VTVTAAEGFGGELLEAGGGAEPAGCLECAEGAA
jgi:hypothetical protein